jgi:hypothetical protein
MIAAILQAIAALPKIFEMLKAAFAAIRQMQEQHRIDEAKKANQEGDTNGLEQKLGSADAGVPSGLDGSVVRHKGGN